MPRTKNDEPDAVDIHVGQRVRLRRKFLHMSQETLAESLKLTFQQVQKYERGTNRISSSKLYQTAKALQVPVSYFFEGYADPDTVSDDFVPSDAETQINGFLQTPEGIELAQAFPRIADPKQRRRVVELVTAMAEPNA